MIMLIPYRPALDIPPYVDLRRHRNQPLAESLLDAAQFLDEPDRALIVAIFRNGDTVNAVAARRGCSRHAVSRRVRMLADRLTSPRFMFALACLPDWPNERQAIARACILNGRSVRDAATSLRLTLYTVRRELHLINDLYREAEAAAEVQR